MRIAHFRKVLLGICVILLSISINSCQDKIEYNLLEKKGDNEVNIYGGSISRDTTGKVYTISIKLDPAFKKSLADSNLTAIIMIDDFKVTTEVFKSDSPTFAYAEFYGFPEKFSARKSEHYIELNFVTKDSTKSYYKYKSKPW